MRQAKSRRNISWLRVHHQNGGCWIDFVVLMLQIYLGLGAVHREETVSVDCSCCLFCSSILWIICGCGCRKFSEADFGCTDKERFQLELEFVQCLSSPQYIHCKWIFLIFLLEISI